MVFLSYYFSSYGVSEEIKKFEMFLVCPVLRQKFMGVYLSFSWRAMQDSLNEQWLSSFESLDV